MAVVVSDIDEERLGAAAADLAYAGFRALAVPADVTDPESMLELVETAVSELGGIDLMCLNAGITPLATPIFEITPGEWQTVMAVNFNGVVNGINAVLPVMQRRGHGHISATASVNGLMADAHIAPYNASKFAVVGLMESLLVDLRRAESPIEVSVLCPGPIATDIIKRGIGVDRGTSAQEHALLNRGMVPDDAGRLALAGILDGQFWIFTHEAMVDRTLRERFDAMATDGTRPADLDWPWDEILDQDVRR
jgi:NAD(P)-dependent dehydrogenase (short-subunit alcohol dehydrogenase family)